eukprot:186975-Hanusia_phi.AAC.3
MRRETESGGEVRVEVEGSGREGEVDGDRDEEGREEGGGRERADERRQLVDDEGRAERLGGSPHKFVVGGAGRGGPGENNRVDPDLRDVQLAHSAWQAEGADGGAVVAPCSLPRQATEQPRRGREGRDLPVWGEEEGGRGGAGRGGTVAAGPDADRVAGDRGVDHGPGPGELEDGVPVGGGGGSSPDDGAGRNVRDEDLEDVAGGGVEEGVGKEAVDPVLSSHVDPEEVEAPPAQLRDPVSHRRVVCRNDVAPSARPRCRRPAGVVLGVGDVVARHLGPAEWAGPGEEDRGVGAVEAETDREEAEVGDRARGQGDGRAQLQVAAQLLEAEVVAAEDLEEEDGGGR